MTQKRIAKTSSTLTKSCLVHCCAFGAEAFAQLMSPASGAAWTHHGFSSNAEMSDWHRTICSAATRSLTVWKVTKAVEEPTSIPPPPMSAMSCIIIAACRARSNRPSATFLPWPYTAPATSPAPPATSAPVFAISSQRRRWQSGAGAFEALPFSSLTAHLSSSPWPSSPSPASPLPVSPSHTSEILDGPLCSGEGPPPALVGVPPPQALPELAMLLALSLRTLPTLLALRCRFRRRLPPLECRRLGADKVCCRGTAKVCCSPREGTRGRDESCAQAPSWVCVPRPALAAAMAMSSVTCRRNCSR
mmetsp:Transcript_143587/g.459291  ORF Transcript_143587/g.459291 Transcript_143587/m.459291 type:complete len:304 (+) Transcript_143587:1316-2227(+)